MVNSINCPLFTIPGLVAYITARRSSQTKCMHEKPSQQYAKNNCLATGDALVSGLVTFVGPCIQVRFTSSIEGLGIRLAYKLL